MVASLLTRRPVRSSVPDDSLARGLVSHRGECAAHPADLGSAPSTSPHDGSGPASSAASSSRSCSTTPASTRAMPASVERPTARWSRTSQPIATAVTGQQREEHREPPHGDPPQHVLVDAVADGVREQRRRAGTRPAGAATSTRRRCPGAPNGVSTTAPIASADAEPGDAAVAAWATREPTTMYAAQHADAGEQPADARRRCRRARRRRARPRRRRRARARRRCARVRVITAATTIGPMNSMATLLPRSVRSIAR